MNKRNIYFKKYRSKFTSSIEEICDLCAHNTYIVNKSIQQDVTGSSYLENKASKKIDRTFLKLETEIFKFHKNLLQDMLIKTAKFYMNDSICKYYIQDILHQILDILYLDIMHGSINIGKKTTIKEDEIIKKIRKTVNKNLEHLFDLIFSLLKEDLSTQEREKSMYCLQDHLNLIYISSELFEISIINCMRDIFLQESSTIKISRTDSDIKNACSGLKQAIVKIKSLFSEYQQLLVYGVYSE